MVNDDLLKELDNDPVVTGILQILETTDLHMQILPYDYFTDRPDPGKGLVQLADQIDRLRSTPGTLTVLCDNGDFLQGNPMADLIADGGLQDAPHPMIDALKVLKYDVIGLGNHEFNYGLPFLDQALRGASCPVVCSNIDWRDEPACSRPYVLLDRRVPCSDGQPRAIRIGVLGLVPPQILQWDHLVVDDAIAISDMVSTAQGLVPQIRQAGADIIVALCHTGLGAEAHRKGMENAARPLAAIPGIDVVLAGHTHEVFAGRLHGKPVVSAGVLGSHLGLVVLSLAHSAQGWRIIKDEYCTLPATQTPPRGARAKQIMADMAGHHSRTRERVRQPVARTGARLHSYFAPILPDLPRQVMASAMIRYARTALPALHLPLLAAVPPFRAGGRAGADHYIDIAPGPICLRDVSAIYPYTDRPVIIHRTGQQLLDWLEQAVSGYGQINPGHSGQRLLDTDFPVYAFDAIFGLTYSINLTQPARHDATGRACAPGANRITDLRHRNLLVAPKQCFAVVVNSYRAFGGGGYATVPACDLLYQSTKQGRDILADDLRAHPDVDRSEQSPWRFAPIRGATAVFASAPAAREHIQTPVRHIGAGKNGFDTYEISFAPLVHNTEFA